jgi:hypothetical protein
MLQLRWDASFFLYCWISKMFSTSSRESEQCRTGASGNHLLFVCFCFVWTLCQWVRIMLCYSEPVVGNHDVDTVPVGVNHVELGWTSGCESRCAMLGQCLWIIVNYVEPVVLKHFELYWASGCESVCVILSRMCGNHVVLCWVSGCISLYVMQSWVCVNNGVFCWASGWESRCLCCASGCGSWWVILSQWLWIIEMHFHKD